MSSLLAGKVAAVTGASSGIGRAIARTFAAEGAILALADITDVPKEGGVPTRDLILQAGGMAQYDTVDVARWEDIDHWLGGVVQQFGRLDVMVNNAATFSGTGLVETSNAQWDEVMGVNMTGMFYGCKRAVQQMLSQEPREEARGRIINLGSQQGIVTSPQDTAYGVSKAGAIYITRQIACDYAKDLIICNSISPGKIVTGKPGLPMDPALLENARRRTPWPRLGRPQDIANAAVFLASDRSTFMTGANLVVDGGWLAA
jgi:NAD(P)-dependent dehydrogenase (short-subunit alcohol dehydrogenase family)